VHQRQNLCRDLENDILGSAIETGGLSGTPVKTLDLIGEYDPASLATPGERYFKRIALGS
jgi:hypothetical protein